MQDKNLKVSVIIPVKNEGAILAKCLESLIKLDYPREYLEIIIADGLSADNSREIALRYGAKVVINNKQIVVSGRNRGFEKAGGEIVAFTDADCTFDINWIKNSLKYFQNESVGGVGGVTLSPDACSYFEKAVNFLFRLAEIFHSTCHRQNLCPSKETDDIPGCNAIYKRGALAKVMPVDENLLTAEDVWMNFCIKNAGYKLISSSDVIVWHHRRSSPKRFLKQIYRFAIGRMQVGRKNPKLLNIFHILAALSLPIFLSMAICFYLSGAINLFLIAVLGVFAVITLSTILTTRSLLAAINISLVIVLFVIAWSLGFLKEFFIPLKDVKGK